MGGGTGGGSGGSFLYILDEIKPYDWDKESDHFIEDLLWYMSQPLIEHTSDCVPTTSMSCLESVFWRCTCGAEPIPN